MRAYRQPAPSASAPAAQQDADGSGQEAPPASAQTPFVLVVTAPPGTGKQALMGAFVVQYAGRIAYIAREGAVHASEPVRCNILCMHARFARFAVLF
jgi:hypothetical protein